MIFPWVGKLNVQFIAVEVADPAYQPLPEDWRNLIERRINYDPFSTTGFDRSLRAYVMDASSGVAQLDATLVGPVSVAGCGAGPAIKAVADSHLYDVACVVFPSGPCGGMAIVRRSSPFPYDEPRAHNKLTGWCRFRINDSSGVWIHELLHAATGFGELYRTSPNPGRYDPMACGCGTHPSSLTKATIGWIPANAIRALGQGEDEESFTLHAVSLVQPPPPGRVTGLRIPTGQAGRYYLLEARLRTDEHELGPFGGFSDGIPKEGVVVYEVNDEPSPMKLREVLSLGQSFQHESDRVSVFVTDAVSGGFTVLVLGCDIIRGRLEFTRQELEAALRALAMWPVDLASTKQRAAIMTRIQELLRRIADLRQHAAFLGCELPGLAVDTFGAEGVNLELPRRGKFIPPKTARGDIAHQDEPEVGTVDPPHQTKVIDLW